MSLKSKEDILYDELKEHIVKFRTNDDVAYFTNICDIHWGLCNKELFLETFNYLMSIPNMYVGIGGDVANGATRISKSDPMEEWSSGDKQIYEIAEVLKPYADRILYIIEGNHSAGRLKHEVYFTPEQMLATLIGKPEIYKREMCFLYFNVGKNCYIHFTQHSSPKREDVWGWVNADVTWREHVHLHYVKDKVVIEHNKFTKQPRPKICYEIYGGTFQIYPAYAKEKGYRMGSVGCFVTEMHNKDRKLYVWSDDQLKRLMKN